MFVRYFVLVIAVCFTSFVYSKPQIQGDWIQGGLLQGKVAPGSKVFIFDREATVSQEGHFVFGLGRDTEKSIELIVQSADGERQTYPYSVKQRSYKTQRIDGVDKKYVAPPPEVSKRIKRDASQVRQARKLDTSIRHYAQGFDWPAEGPITGVYGSQRVFNGVPKRPHYGLDIAGPVGTRVVAPASGVITLTHDNMYYSGGTVIIDHGHGVSSTFLHLSKILVKEGARVQQGELVAELGASGRVTGPHLDWRVNWFNQRLDPLLLLPPAPKRGQQGVK